MYEQGMPDNYIALNYAIDINEREAKFYLNPLARGTSSLHYDIIDFEMERFASQIKTTTVRTIRLDTIIKKHNIKEIRFFTMYNKKLPVTKIKYKLSPLKKSE